MSNSRLDVACISECGRLVFKVEEAKKSEHGITSQDTITNLQQLAGYLFSAIAFSVWGVLKSKKPIVGLLVYPSAIYRLSFWKPEDSVEVPLGLYHKVEYTEEPLMMGWFLEQFVQDFEADYVLAKQMESKLDFEHVDPVDWTCVNLKFGTHLCLSSQSNLGFLFESSGEQLMNFMDCCSKRKLKSQLFRCEEIPKDEKLVVKYLSALLVSPPALNYAPVARLVEAHEKAALVHEKAALVHEKAALQELLAAPGRPAEIKAATQSASTGPSPSQFCYGIKHPYIAVVIFAAVHPFLIMRDVGTTLNVMIARSDFLAKWKTSTDFRLKFQDDVGLSALNLVEELMLCHNDIRLPNIAVKDDAFCLIDFDNSRSDVPSDARQSRILLRYPGLASPERNMMYTVGQIAMIVFALDTDTQAAELNDVRVHWLISNPSRPTSKQQRILARFDAWVKSKGKLMEIVFFKTALPPALGGNSDDKSFFVRILNSMLT
eukprot:CAMPEP_0172169808 /NCGR_PEP_ID=MMETSP1050-20130122/10912_1 /TAXON_ID=233186 /ORGANISM="Cryptomonas curvata, Strain CCAP979/52" /LENGTH=488 /DNA_ID=CAMNT_0012840909 /DNA_START=802 /DNA_END=2268 /DNA_ORIENTATION=+